MKLYFDFEDNEQSKIFNNEDFGYWKILIQRPLRLKVVLNKETIERIQNVYDKLNLLVKNNKLTPKEIENLGLKNSKTALKELENVDNIRVLVEELNRFKSEDPYMDFGKFEREFNKELKNYDIKGLSFKTLEKIGFSDFFVVKDECGEIVKDLKGNVIYDSGLNDFKMVPFNYKGGIEGYLKNEILPYIPDAYINESETKIGYEIGFTKYFYRSEKLECKDKIFEDVIKVGVDLDKIFKSIKNTYEIKKKTPKI